MHGKEAADTAVRIREFRAAEDTPAVTEILRESPEAAGWSEQQVRSGGAVDVTPDTDWTKGFDAGLKEGANAQCTAPPGIANGGEWMLGCESGQKAQ